MGFWSTLPMFSFASWEGGHLVGFCGVIFSLTGFHFGVGDVVVFRFF